MFFHLVKDSWPSVSPASLQGCGIIALRLTMRNRNERGKVAKDKERAEILGKHSVSMTSDISVQTRQPVNQAEAGLAQTRTHTHTHTHTYSHKHTPTFTPKHICLLMDLQSGASLHVP